MPFYVAVGRRGHLIRAGTFLLRMMGSVAYRWDSRRRATPAVPWTFPGGYFGSTGMGTMRLEAIATEGEVGQIQAICAELGVDGEMTALVMGSHRRDRALPGPMLLDGEDLRDYVRRKLTTWEAILEGPVP